MEGARIVTYAIDVLREFAPDRIAAWLESARELTDPSHHDMYVNREMFTASVADALAANGEWDAAPRADGYPPRARRARRSGGSPAARGEGLRPGRRARAMQFSTRSGGRRRTRRQGQGGRGAGGRRRGAGARRRIARAGQQELARATARCLVNLPEGDSDELRRLQAAALHEDGATDEVVAVLQRISWVTVVAKTVASLVLSGTIDPVRRDAYASALLMELKAREGAGLYGDALREVAPTVVRLARDASPVAGALGDFLVEQIATLPVDDQIVIYATISAGACHVDPDSGALQYRKLIEWIEALQARGEELPASTVAEAIVELASAAAPLGARLAPLTERVAALADGFEGADDAVTVRGALSPIAAQNDCQAARAAMEHLVPSIAALAEAPPSALYITRMFADLVGRRAGANEIQARAASSLAKAVVRCAHPCPVEAARVIEQVINQALAIRSEVDRAQALIDIFGSLGQGPAAWPRRLESALSAALRRAQLGDARLERSVFAAAVEAMCAADDPDAAERLARQADDAPMVEELLTEVAAERERLALGELSNSSAPS